MPCRRDRAAGTRAGPPWITAISPRRDGRGRRWPGADQAVFANAANQANPAPVTFANGFVLSRYAETGGPGSNLKHPPRNLCHAQPRQHRHAKLKFRPFRRRRQLRIGF
jgi:hypothetical protein